MFPAINITYQMISKRSNCAIFTEHTVLVFSVASNRDERESVSTKDRYYTSVYFNAYTVTKGDLERSS